MDNKDKIKVLESELTKISNAITWNLNKGDILRDIFHKIHRLNKEDKDAEKIIYAEMNYNIEARLELENKRTDLIWKIRELEEVIE